MCHAALVSSSDNPGARLTALLTTILFVAACVGPRASESGDYEIWVMDQGTNIVHIYSSALEETAAMDLGAMDVRVPHMIEFTPDYRYAFVANAATGNVAVIRAADREVVALIPTGPRTHHAAVSPDGRTVLVSVIGAVNTPWDGKLVELEVDADNERFTVGRELLLASDSLFASHMGSFQETTGAVCLDFSADGRHGYVTLGPGLAEGGAVVVDLEAFRIIEAFPPSVLDVNYGITLAPDGRHMYLVGGDREVGTWHAIDTRTHRPARRAETRGHDAHGLAVTPDGREYWLVNRVTSNAIVADTRTGEVIAEIPFVGKTPDNVAISPDNRFAFITLRGPKPVTMPHLAVGETPGFAVLDVRTRELVRIVEPARGNEASDFHGIAVRPLSR